MNTQADPKAGEIDPSFKATFEHFEGRVSLQEIQPTRDGGVLVVTEGSSRYAHISKFTKNGSLDKNFYGVGYFETPFRSGRETPWQYYIIGVSVDDRNNIYISGNPENPNDSIFVYKYKDNGELDTSFGNDGRATIRYPGTLEYPQAGTFHPESLAPFKSDQAGGSLQVTTTPRAIMDVDGLYLLAAGRINADANPRILVARLKLDGHLDEDFGKDGIKTIEPTLGTGEYPRMGVLQPAGKQTAKLLVLIEGAPAEQGPWKVVRLNRNGELDEDFGTDGAISESGYYATQINVFVDEDAKIKISHSRVIRGSDRMICHVSGWTSDGRVDRGFGIEGKLELDPGRDHFLVGYAMRSYGRGDDYRLIHLAGDTWTGGDIVAMRTRADGTPDKNFGNENGSISYPGVTWGGGNARVPFALPDQPRRAYIRNHSAVIRIVL